MTQSANTAYSARAEETAVLTDPVKGNKQKRHVTRLDGCTPLHGGSRCYLGIRNIQITGLSRKPRMIEPIANTVWPAQQVCDSGESIHNMCDSDATQTPRPARAKRAEIEVCPCDSGGIYFEMAHAPSALALLPRQRPVSRPAESAPPATAPSTGSPAPGQPCPTRVSAISAVVPTKPTRREVHTHQAARSRYDSHRRRRSVPARGRAQVATRPGRLLRGRERPIPGQWFVARWPREYKCRETRRNANRGSEDPV